MAAMAAQQAQHKAERKVPAGAPKNRQAPQKESGSLKEKLYALPQAAGIALMMAMLVLSLFIGNFRALQSATPKAFLRQQYQGYS